MNTIYPVRVQCSKCRQWFEFESDIPQRVYDFWHEHVSPAMCHACQFPEDHQ